MGAEPAEGPKGPTERRAAKAARQLAYHREKVHWIEERMAENTAVIEAYLTIQGEDEATLPGGRRVALDAAGGVEVGEAAPGTGYEQLELIPSHTMES